MKLYYAPGACSMAPHIALREAELPFELVKTDIRTKRTEDGRDFLKINPKGAVPTLELANGTILTENAAILQYIGDRAPDSTLFPRPDQFERYRIIEWLNYIATELHKGFGPFWNPTTSDELKHVTRNFIASRLNYVSQRLGDYPYLRFRRFTLADAYLFVILRWTHVHEIELGRWPNLVAFEARVAERPAVAQAMTAEGFGP
jgi:glutathione S-transferase